ncbi:MAG: hypothetical protein A2175_02280 [Candidatus Nealsonbacteria bacterium RBG_13_42_11]|uniref:Transcobalamin-like C-terminal domain-containing protein n=1 Tax=Candidatus Nealsonbacteria bacterium RBG_13_42_11 TaxID=1801663 RepID=A0A1G2DZH0_9BACT|nr:MAG: hypothetical protein A2175_02280 [Candidatus Nealsonbacteria bacterium RBG_13_42_11]
MKKIYIFLGIGIGIILIIGSWLMFSSKISQQAFQEEIKISQGDIKKEIVLLVIDDGEGAPKNFEVEFNEGMTAFDLLEEGTENSDLFLKTKTYDIGILIEAIGDKENGQDEKYWFYYVNGKMPMISADKEEIKLEDKVEFRFEKSSF